MVRLARFLAVVVLLLSCSVARVEACKPMVERMLQRVEVVGVVDITHLSTSGMNLYVEVDNNSLHRLVVKEGEVDILSKGEVIATISLRDRVVIKGRRTSTVLVPLRFRARSSFVLSSLLKRLASEEDMRLSYRICGGTGMYKRTLAAEDITVGELLSAELLEQLMVLATK
jgi:hypothetical protein